MAGAMAETLAAVDPDNAARYETNAAMLGHTLDALDRELDAALAPVRGVPFLVFHDAYQYFERRYGLRALGAVTLSPERRPGARRIYEMRDALARLGARCVFREPLYDAASVEAIVSGTGAGTGTLDPLGVDLQIGADLYFSLLRGLASSLRQCLAR